MSDDNRIPRRKEYAQVALFKVISVAPAQPSAELCSLLELANGEPVVLRRLRGVGRWDRGRRLEEFIASGRLPSHLDYRQHLTLSDLLDEQAPAFKYGEMYSGDLLKRYGLQEGVLLHQWVDNPNPVAEADEPDWMQSVEWDDDIVQRPFAALLFYPTGPLSDATNRLWRFARRLVTGKRL